MLLLPLVREDAAEAEATAKATVDLTKVVAAAGDVADVGIEDNVVDDEESVVNVNIDVNNRIIQSGGGGTATNRGGGRCFYCCCLVC